MNCKVFIFLALLGGARLYGQSNVSCVNPMIGATQMGHTFPGACVPHGAVQLSPDTDTIPHNIGGTYQKDAYRYCAGYQYDDPTIVGFSHTHFSGTGHSDLGDILLMPVTGTPKLNPGTADRPETGYRSRFSHATETAQPGYYEVVPAHYEQSVHKMLPVWSHNGNENWCMIGYHSVSVLADAIATGIPVDRKRALEAMQRTANVPYYGGLSDYIRLGYVPVDVKSDGSSMTLEYAYDDWTICRTARQAQRQAVPQSLHHLRRPQGRGGTCF